jgi:hypothetical protein
VMPPAKPSPEPQQPSRLSLETIRRLRRIAEELLTMIDGDANK